MTAVLPDLSFQNLMYNLQNDWLGFAVVFAIVFAVVYIGISKFFMKDEGMIDKQIRHGFSKSVQGKRYVENKPFIIIISVGVALLTAASVVQMGLLRIIDSGYGFVFSAGIIFIVFSILMIPFYKFIDKNIENRIFTNLISVVAFWATMFIMKNRALYLQNISYEWIRMLRTFASVPMLLLGLVGAVILGLIFKKK